MITLYSCTDLDEVFIFSGSVYLFTHLLLFEKNGVWTWDFFYHKSTAFIFPEEVDLLFVNERPVFLDDKEGSEREGTAEAGTFETEA